MAQLITTLFIELIIVSPIIGIALNRTDRRWKYLILFSLYYLGYSCLLFTPLLYPALSIFDSDWNWSGKIYAIVGSILFYILFRKAFATHNYITLKQRDTSLKPALIVTIIVFLLAIALAILSPHTSSTQSDYFLFQFTMPGLDEELAYRGIMLGLLSNALPSRVYFKNKSLGNPALLITSILFGLVHSFQIDQGWCFHQNWFEFISTFATGLLLGWLTIKSGSILMSILIHDLINTLPGLITLTINQF